MNGSRFMAGMPYGETWRARRKMFQRHFPQSPQNQVTISRTEEFVRKYLLPNLLDTPKEFSKHIRDTVGGIVLSLAYGFRIHPSDDPWIKLAERMSRLVTEAGVPGKYLVDIIPVLKYVPEWFPGASFQKTAKEGRGIVNNFFKQLYDAAVQEIVSPKSLPHYL
jgi:hypothetical protein